MYENKETNRFGKIMTKRKYIGFLFVELSHTKIGTSIERMRRSRFLFISSKALTQN